MKKLNINLEKAVDKRIKQVENKKDFEMNTLSQVASISWNFFVPVIGSIFLGKFIVDKFNLKSDILLSFIVFGLFLGGLNSFFILKNLFKSEVKNG